MLGANLVPVSDSCEIFGEDDTVKGLLSAEVLPSVSDAVTWQPIP